jgi:hypothetical protein
MNDRVRFELVDDGTALDIWVRDPKLRDHDAVLRLHHRMQVERSGGHSARKEVLKKSLRLGAQQRVALPENVRALFGYSGGIVRIDLLAELKIDDGVIIDTTIEATATGFERRPPRVAEGELGKIDPKDRFSFVANLKAIPYKNRVIAVLLAAFGLVVGTVNVLIGVHDEMMPESQTLLYDHRGSHGSESPLMKSLSGSGALGFAIWMALRAQLRRYMTLTLKAPQRIGRSTVLEARALIAGVPRVVLQNVLVRVVAYNHEFGQYTTGSGKKRKTRTETKPIRAVVLYEQRVPHLSARSELARELSGEVAFAEVFEALYPAAEFGSSGGIKLGWELQLLHELFVDQEITGSADAFDEREFWNLRRDAAPAPTREDLHAARAEDAARFRV